ncbi:hypothetical protein SynPROSU1_03027 [Synechococcus sp. PROS-U-1]|nr:hypothetical protein SynPROSU1_03027 [Synechococcus sp. PROS-U-1]
MKHQSRIMNIDNPNFKQVVGDAQLIINQDCKQKTAKY